MHAPHKVRRMRMPSGDVPHSSTRIGLLYCLTSRSACARLAVSVLLSRPKQLGYTSPAASTNQKPSKYACKSIGLHCGTQWCFMHTSPLITYETPTQVNHVLHPTLHPVMFSRPQSASRDVIWACPSFQQKKRKL